MTKLTGLLMTILVATAPLALAETQGGQTEEVRAEAEQSPGQGMMQGKGQGGMKGMHGSKGHGGMKGMHRGKGHGGKGGMKGMHGGKGGMHKRHADVVQRLERIERRQKVIEAMLRQLLYD